MSTRTKEVLSAFPKFRQTIAMLSLAMLAGCDYAPVSQANALEDEKPASAEVLADSVPPVRYEGELPVLRFQLDRVRERGWILTRTGVLIVDFKTRQTTGYVPLPDWQWAGEEFSCLPDLVLGPKGEALISSNVVPTLWRIDPDTLSVSRHELALDADSEKDVGFAGLAYSAEAQTLFAVSEFGALWQIDPLLQRARKIALSAAIPKACGVTVRTAEKRFPGLCVRGPKGAWSVDLAPDGRSARVFARSCAAAQSPRRIQGRQPIEESDFASSTAPASYRELGWPVTNSRSRNAARLSWR